MTEPILDPWVFQDTSTECAICLEPLEESDFLPSTAQQSPTSKSTIRLACGHRWHLECLREQLESARPTSSKRLLFSGCQCAKCGTVCEHEALEDYTRTTDALRQKVNILLENQLNNDVASLHSNANEKKKNNGDEEISSHQSKLLLAWKKVKDSEHPEAKERVLREARKKYAFYLCSHCQEPYFGGTVECSDGMVEEEESSSDNEQRLCMACTPQVVCRNPVEHLGSIVWKCRYCCQPATHICYGNVHFCDGCHDRNSKRARQLQVWKRNERQGRRNGQGGSTPSPPPLKAIPCVGKDCPFPKPSAASFNDGSNSATVASVSNSSTSGAAEFHSNGPTANCEQVYACLLCQSSSSSSEQELSGSHNLITNHSGQLGLQGWQQLNRRIAWKVEDSEWPVNAQTTTNFVSSFEVCVMCQVVDLQQVIRNIAADNNELPFRTDNFSVQVSARYQGRTDCPSVFRLEAIAMDRHRRQVQRLQTEVLDAPLDHWAKAELELEHLALQRVQYVGIVVSGKDRRFWQGNYGSKVADCSIRILWDENNANGQNQNEVLPRNLNEGNAANRGIQQPAQPRGHEIHEVRPGQEQQRNWLLLDLIFPSLCFVILAWLAK